jgi:DNA-binding CsgD family transcriptional regulator/tetratricopeptide (TPR) repeat protein
VPGSTRRRDEHVTGRDTELAVVDGFLEREDGARALVVTGDPGIGKTALWEAALRSAHDRGTRVLATRASGAEARLSLAGLMDLLDGVDDGELSALPAPQRRALEVALLRVDPGAEHRPESRAIALGLLNALRRLAAERPLLVAVDDVGWLDRPSADALAFAARRLDGDATCFLLTRRPGRRSVVERALETERLEIGPLSYGAIRRLLSERLGLVLPRHLLRRLVDTTLGNPLFALEVGRELADSGLPPVGEELPVPDAVEELLGLRVSRLPAATRTLLLATALSADLTVSELEAITGSGAVDDAIDAGVLLVDGDRVRAAHPLLAAAARKRARPRARRELHGELAVTVADEELRARHLALAADGPDDALAATVAHAASAASARGAKAEAADLAEQALRLTPRESGNRYDRLFELAEYLSSAGRESRLVELLSPELDAMPAGPVRGRAHFLLADTASHLDEGMSHLVRAMAEAADDRALRARALARRSLYLALGSVDRLPEADRCAQEAWLAARELDPETELDVLHAPAWASILRGRPIDDLCERRGTLSTAETFLLFSVERAAAVRLGWRGDVDGARAFLRRLAVLADERGEATSYVVLRTHLCELELRAGDWDAASRLLEEWRHSGEKDLMSGTSYLRCLATLAVGRGRADEAEQWAARALAGDTRGLRWSLLEALHARGVGALLAHDPQRALESLRPVWEHTEREGVDDLGAFPVAPDLVEALVESDELDAAQAVLDRLQRLADEQRHPWGLATAKRCGGLLALARGPYEPAAAAAVEDAAGEYARLGLRFDAARALLELGRAQRRHKRWAAARGSLERAAAAFDEIGSPGWAEEARSELARVGARRPRARGQLTSTEQRVAELAARGLSNKEIARSLFVTVNTVEAHLSHAYAKLGIRSRAQLAARLDGNP